MINKERKIRKIINKSIKLEKWGEFFRRMLGGMEKRIVGRERRGRERGKELR